VTAFVAAFTSLDWLLLLVVVLLLFVLIFLAVAEMGLSRMTKPKAAALAERRPRQGRALIDLIEEPEKWVNPLLLTVNICQTVQATLTGVITSRAFGPVGVAVGVVANVLVFFVLAEAVPKTYAVLFSERAALMSARGIRVLVRFEEGPFVKEQEFLGVVEAAAIEEVIEKHERDLIESVIEFGDTVAREIMVPLPDMVTVHQSTTIDAAIGVSIEHGFSRLPVLNDDDDVIGIAFMKDLVRIERSGGGANPVSAQMRRVVVVPENKPVSKLMREMQANKFHLAVVADEYGSITGLITLEDCLEELVGEIADEYDDEDVDIAALPNGDFMVDGATSVGDVNDRLSTRIPDEEWDSIGGFIFGTLEHVPVVGEHVDFEGWRFTVSELEGRRIRKVRVSLIEAQVAGD
jgi:CBS domain containing-hemolysin-like protein